MCLIDPCSERNVTFLYTNCVSLLFCTARPFCFEPSTLMIINFALVFFAFTHMAVFPSQRVCCFSSLFNLK
jgi:hypothetical protein